MLDLQELVVFLSAADNGNFSETGRTLHLSQPAVSQIIRNLEIRLGTKLFIRKGRTIRLTEAGIALIPMAKELLSCANRLKTDITSLHGEINGEINIGCSTCSGLHSAQSFCLLCIFPSLALGLEFLDDFVCSHAPTVNGLLTTKLVWNNARGAGTDLHGLHGLTRTTRTTRTR